MAIRVRYVDGFKDPFAKDVTYNKGYSWSIDKEQNLTLHDRISNRIATYREGVWLTVESVPDVD